MLRPKGQAIIEFMALTILALTIFSLYMPVAWNREKLVREEREDLMAWRIIADVAKEINLASSFGPGYERNFTIPEKLITTNYSIKAINQSLVIYISWKDRQITEQIITPNITSVPSPGANTIKNIDGVITFE